MTREEVKVVFTGIAHDHLMASTRIHQTTPDVQGHNQYQQQRNHIRSENHQQHLTNKTYNGNHHQHHHHNHQHYHTKTNNSNQNQLQPQDTNSNTTANVACPLTALAQVDSKPQEENASALSTIAILRRLTMYDSLVLVKKYRPCLDGYSLEFPTANDNSKGDAKTSETTENAGSHSGNCGQSCGRTKLVSVYLDGDDPIYQCQQNRLGQQNGTNGGGQPETNDGEVVYVPLNGLLDRLENYDRHGIAIDSRVYAFAMGLKTAERFLTSSTEKEIQEAPPF